MILWLSKTLSYFDIKLLKAYRIICVHIVFAILLNVSVYRQKD